MAQIIPIDLGDGTIVHIEAVENTSLSTEEALASGGQESTDDPKRSLWLLEESQQQAQESIQTIEDTVRAYTSHILKSFRNLAAAEVSEVTLEFGVSASGITGIPYIASGKAGGNVKITVKCVFPKQEKEEK